MAWRQFARLDRLVCVIDEHNGLVGALKCVHEVDALQVVVDLNAALHAHQDTFVFQLALVVDLNPARQVLLACVCQSGRQRLISVICLMAKNCISTKPTKTYPLMVDLPGFVQVNVDAVQGHDLGVN